MENLHKLDEKLKGNGAFLGAKWRLRQGQLAAMRKLTQQRTKNVPLRVGAFCKIISVLLL